MFVSLAIPQGKYKSGLSPVTLFKAVKNSAELEGFRQCHIRDGVALVRYFAWLEEELNLGHEHTEYAAAEKLEQYRVCVLSSWFE
jgi:Xaa-Pro aminopeptidase